MDMLGFFIAESPNPEQLSLGRLVMWTIFYGSYTVLLASPFIFMLLSSISTFELIKWQQEFNRWIFLLRPLSLHL
jgi:hypothetical protein